MVLLVWSMDCLLLLLLLLLSLWARWLWRWWWRSILNIYWSILTVDEWKWRDHRWVVHVVSGAVLRVLLLGRSVGFGGFGLVRGGRWCRRGSEWSGVIALLVSGCFRWSWLLLGCAQVNRNWVFGLFGEWDAAWTGALGFGGSGNTGW